MKFYAFILILLLFILPAESQVSQYLDVENLYDGTDWEDKITTVESYPDYWLNMRLYTRYVHSDSASIDTLTTKPVENRSWGDKFISFTMDTDSNLTTEADTLSYKLLMGVFRGAGTVTGTSGGSIDADGIYWKHLFTGTSDTSIEISLRDSTWWTDFPTPYYWYQIAETDTQYNRYYISDFVLKER